MGPTIKLVAFLLFAACLVSLFYLQHCINEYRDSVPKPTGLDPLTAIRASFRWVHDPNDPAVSEECRMNVRRVKTAALVAGAVWTIYATSIGAAAMFDLGRFLD